MRMGNKLSTIVLMMNKTGGCLCHKPLMNLVVVKTSFTKDFAVLYRTNAQSRTIEALLKSNIPYTMVSGTKFYSRKIRDIIAYLNLIINLVIISRFW